MMVDVVLAAVLTVLTVTTLISQAPGRSDWRAVVLAILTVAPIAVRQRAPVLALTVILLALGACGLLRYGDIPSGGVGMLVAMFTVATLRSRAVAAVMFVASLGVIGVAYRAIDGIVWSQPAQAALIILGAWVLGESTRRWAERAERAATAAAQAVADERVRIARELHDVVAHHMSVISLQAGVAEYVLDVDLPTAKNAIATVADASREALLDMRRMLDVLRVGADGESDYHPQPGLAQLDELVERTRGAGLPVQVAVTGRARPLPAGPDLCAYRVVQESLTNVLKHAGPAAARVTVDYGDRTLAVTVSDNGRKGRAEAESAISHGIRGMRERAELYGGVLTAGPGGTGGFTVSLRLPIEELP